MLYARKAPNKTTSHQYFVIHFWDTRWVAQELEWMETINDLVKKWVLPKLLWVLRNGQVVAQWRAPFRNEFDLRSTWLKDPWRSIRPCCKCFYLTFSDYILYYKSRFTILCSLSTLIFLIINHHLVFLPIIMSSIHFWLPLLYTKIPFQYYILCSYLFIDFYCILRWNITLFQLGIHVNVGSRFFQCSHFISYILGFFQNFLNMFLSIFLHINFLQHKISLYTTKVSFCPEANITITDSNNLKYHWTCIYHSQNYNLLYSFWHSITPECGFRRIDSLDPKFSLSISAKSPYQIHIILDSRNT